MEDQGFSMKRSHSEYNISSPNPSIASPQPLRKSPKINAKIFEEINDDGEDQLTMISTRRFHSDIVFSKFRLDDSYPESSNGSPFCSPSNDPAVSTNQDSEKDSENPEELCFELPNRSSNPVIFDENFRNTHSSRSNYSSNSLILKRAQ